QFAQGTDHPRSWQAGIDVNAQRFPVVVVNDIEGAEATARPERIRHEVHRPYFVGTSRHFQRLPDPFWQSLFTPTRQVQAQLAVDPPQHSFAPRLALHAEAVVQLVETMPGVPGD